MKKIEEIPYISGYQTPPISHEIEVKINNVKGRVFLIVIVNQNSYNY
tara:strand:+ start:852 stop:992 length:141 start_codon:yes stop_codon:yes gene_type:complete